MQNPFLGYDQIEETAAWLDERLEQKPQIALILGSGLGALADEFEDAQRFEYETIPHFPTSTVKGHAGRLVFGKIEGKYAVAMQGRFHAYEGWGLDQVTFPVRVFARLGCKALFVTNSAGGINGDFGDGDLMLISDHINLTGRNPLVGENDERLGPRFPDMSDAYDIELRRFALRTAREMGIHLKTGIYAGVLGPSYETPAEVSMLRRMGADAVGMSTVPEVIVAKHEGLQVMGISCITNMAAGVNDQHLDHKDVTAVAARVRGHFIKVLRALIEGLPAA